MEFNVNTQEIAGAVSIALGAKPAKSVLPILEGIYISAENNTLTVVCTDMSLRIETTIPAEVITPGAAVLPSQVFSNMIRRMPNNEVRFKSVKNSMLVTSGRAKSNMQITLSSDYPAMPEIGEFTTISINGGVFREMVRQTTFAAQKDESNPMLCGILADIDGENIRLIALDGYRMAMREEPLNNKVEPISIVLSYKSLEAIAKLITDEESDIELKISKKYVLAEFSGTKLVARLLDTKFIKYESVISSSYRTHLVINREEMLAAVARANVFLFEGKNDVVRMLFKNDSVMITSASEIGGSEEEVQCEGSGDVIEISFKAAYVSDVLSRLTDDEIVIELNSSVSNCMIKPASGSRFCYLIMPIRIN